MVDGVLALSWQNVIQSKLDITILLSLYNEVLDITNLYITTSSI